MMVRDWHRWVVVALICASNLIGAWYIAREIRLWAADQKRLIAEQIEMERRSTCVLFMSGEKRDELRGNVDSWTWNRECDWMENVKP